MPTYYDPSFYSCDEDIFIGVVHCRWCKKELLAVWDRDRLVTEGNRCTYPFYPLPYMGRPLERRKAVPGIYAYSDVLNAIKKKCDLFDALVNVFFRVRNPDNRLAAEFLENPYNIELLCSNCLIDATRQDQYRKVLKLRNTYYRVGIASPSETESGILAKLGFGGKRILRRSYKSRQKNIKP